MAPPTARHKPNAPGKFKSDARSLKRKRDVVDHEKLQNLVDELFYVLCPLADKLDTLFSFIRSNIKAKIIVFLSSGKQVRFVYESFRHLQPARGLDFPAVDWVIQLDCPEDADTYIHRVGRTARYERAGKAVLFLDPSEEEGMLKRLEQKKVPIQRTKPREKKQQSIKNQLQNMCFQDPELKYLGQKAFVSYARSIFVQKDKEIYHINKYDLEGYAASMGLPGAPKIKFRKGEDAKKAKNIPRALLSSEEESDDEPKEPKKPEVRTKYDRMFERRNQDVLSGHYSKLIAEDGHDEIDDARKDADDDNDFLSVKRVVSVDESSDDDEASDEGDAIPGAKIIPGVGREAIVIDSKRKEKLMTSKKKLLKLKEKGTKLVFDDEGKPHEMYELEDERDFVRRGPADAQRAKFVELATEKVREADLDDKELAKQKKRERREKKKAKYAEENAGSEDEAPALVEDGDHQDPLELLASLPLADEEDSKPAKRPKKWFEDDSEDEKRKPKKNKRVIETADEPETLEDLEALAAGLLK
ncbi:putative ATP-dependent RNA helicase dbp4 [Glarea lozoyensis 74030]|uniref:ATP-dependent RNA helicase n=1 Tax=Glarea lozoyensis (strain ATCC 74030 / MF5533) TaxID=1104152 RepID=H0EIX2_GLAL7|nr:putative ATP-dependent RNA helicase dbp4 [Glarea lozoyensis 74030]